MNFEKAGQIIANRENANARRTAAISKKRYETREANCRVCHEPFLSTRRNPSDLWREVCNRSACRGFGLFSVKAPMFPRRERLHSNQVDGGGQSGRFLLNVRPGTFAAK